MVGDLLAVGDDLFAGQILVLGHVGQDGLNALCQASRDFVDLFILLVLGFFRRLGQRVIGLNLVRDGLGELIHAVSVHLRHFLLRHEHIGSAFLDRVLQQCVDVSDLVPRVLGSSLDIRFGLGSQVIDLLLLANRHFINGLEEPKRSSDDHDRGQDYGGKLLFQFLPHCRNLG